MITLSIKTPVLGDLIFSDKAVISYEVKDTEGIFNKVVFVLNEVVIEKTTRSGLFEVTIPEGNHTLVAYVKNRFDKEILSTRNTIDFASKPITLEIKNKLSSVVSSSIPDFLEQDYTVFVDFVKYYYQWLESTKNPYYIPHTIEQFLDVDTVPPEFLDKFYATYLSAFPTQFSKDKETGANLDITKVIKRIKEFYAKKGTEDSFRFLFRLMFDTEITFTYPREKILSASTGEWIESKFIRLKSVPLTLEEILNLSGTNIYYLNESGNKTFSATISEVLFTSYNNTQIASLYLTNVIGELTDSYVYFDKVILGVQETLKIDLYNMIVKSEITACPSYDHRVGEKVIAKYVQNTVQSCASGCSPFKSSTNLPAPTGYGYYAYVKEVDEYGSIISILIVDPGVNYVLNLNNRFATLVEDVNLSCVITHTLGYLFEEEGKYKTKKSLLSELSILQDNFYYQQNSYEIGAYITPYRYSDILKENVHPAGYKAFYRYDILDTIIEAKKITRDVTTSAPATDIASLPFKDAISDVLSRRQNTNVLGINTSYTSSTDY